MYLHEKPKPTEAQLEQIRKLSRSVPLTNTAAHYFFAELLDIADRLQTLIYAQERDPQPEQDFILRGESLVWEMRELVDPLSSFLREITAATEVYDLDDPSECFYRRHNGFQQAAWYQVRELDACLGGWATGVDWDLEIYKLKAAFLAVLLRKEENVRKRDQAAAVNVSEKEAANDHS